MSTYFIIFYNNFTIINTILFFIFTRLQLFNYLSPRELSPNATLQRFQLFGIFFFNVNGKIYFISKVFRFTLQTLVELSLSGEPKTIFSGLQSSSLRKNTSFSSVSFPSLFRRTRHGGVGQRSGTRLETPLLGWALPLKILNHGSLGVDVPVFFHPGDVASFSYFLSSIHSLSIHFQWLPDT